MAVKTIRVARLVEMTNKALASTTIHYDTEAEARAWREGIATVLDTVLFGTGNYQGFSYQRSELDQDGILKDDYDDTRRIYYYPKGS